MMNRFVLPMYPRYAMLVTSCAFSVGLIHCSDASSAGGSTGTEQSDAGAVRADGSTSPANSNGDSGSGPAADPFILDVQAGAAATCAILRGGKLKCWGYQGGGPGTDGFFVGDRPKDMGDELPYIDFGADAKVKQVAIGQLTTCALLTSSEVRCWGSNRYGQLGESSVTKPVSFGTGRSAKAIAGTGDHFCAILDNDRLKCWGANNWGALGLGVPDDFGSSARGNDPGEMGDALPYVDLGAGRTVKAVGASFDHTCALLDNDRVKCWGYASALGYGDDEVRGDGPGEMGDALPYVDLGTGRTAKSLTVGEANCVILDNAKVKCWASNYYGSLGLGDTKNRGDAPGQMGDALPYVDLGAGRTAKAISGMWFHVCALLDNDRVKCWGKNEGGTLGLGDAATRGDGPGEMGDALPYVDLGTNRTVKRLVAANTHACAILDNDTLKCWGQAAYGPLGLEDNVNRGDKPGQMGENLPAVKLVGP